MPDVSQVLNVAQYVAPGFLLVQVLYLMKVNFVHKRSDFERGVWSIILSLPIRWVGTKLITLVGIEINQGLTFEMYLLALALAGGIFVALAKSLFSFEAED